MSKRKNDIIVMYKEMLIYVTTYPSVTQFHEDVDSNMPVGDLIKKIDKSGDSDRRLIIDRAQSFHRIPVDDPVNLYYDGKVGEMYRIMDGSSTRYRLVVPPFIVSKDKVKPKEKSVNGVMYANGYDTMLTLLADRGCDKQILAKYAISKEKVLEYYSKGNIHSMTLPDMQTSDLLTNYRGQAVYVFFLPPLDDSMTSKRVSDFLKGPLLDYANSAVAHFNMASKSNLATLAAEDLRKTTGAIQAFAKNISIILVYNNAKGATELDPGMRTRIYQGFAIQNLAFNITRHIDQPEFTLLNIDDHRDEIRDMYAINGRTLSAEATIGSYGLKDGAKLILI